MADQLMEVISGASHGSYSFIHDNYIYRINKFTHKRVYLSCRLPRCRGAGKGFKGATRGEVYGFKLSKPHNHPPEENKIRHFEVKDYVREEALRTQDSSRQIYERAVKLFRCYDLSRACVDGLVKRSRERNAAENGENAVPRRNTRRKEEDYGSEEIIETGAPETDDDPMYNEDMVEEELGEEEEEAAVVEETCEPGELEDEDENEIMEVVIEGEQEDRVEPQEVLVEYVESNGDGVHEEVVMDEDEVSSNLESDADDSYSPEEPLSDSDSSLGSEVIVAPRNRPQGHLANASSRLQRQNIPPNERRIRKRALASDTEDDRPNEKYPRIEEALMKVFSTTYFSTKDNVFNLLNNPEATSDEGESSSVKSTNSLNIIKSASKLCSFAAVKASQMRNLLIRKTKELGELEDVLLEHLSNLMCFSGTEFFHKCFGQPLRESIQLGKRNNPKGKSVWNEDDIFRESGNNSSQLAVALLCYSGKAYSALGELIDLPSPHVARQWATNAEGLPGFSAQPFAAIRKAVNADRSKTVSVCLSVEDVSLERHIDPTLFGYTDLGYGRVESDSIPEATRAVVFFASALNSHWKLPLGYCLADNLTPQVRANLISQFVSKLEFNGVKCVGVVLNSSTTSSRIFEEFGVIIKGALPLGSFHTNAFEKIRVSPFVDILQVMESVKLLLKEKRSFFTSTGDEICWSHLENVHELFLSEGSDSELLPRTYSTDFMNFLKFLKVKIRADKRPFGKYLPVAMKILRKFGACQFENAAPTISFVTTMVDITEVFTRCRFEKKISLSNDKDSFATINKWIHYLENLEFPSGICVKDDDRRMPLMNICMNLASLKVLLRRVFDNREGHFERLSLDGVNEFITRIRDGNSLPTPVQFKTAYLNLVRNTDISPSGNMIGRHRTTRMARPKFRLESTFFSSKMYVYAPLHSMCDLVSDFFREKVINVWMDAVDCPECLEVMLDGLHDERSALSTDVSNLMRRVEVELRVMREIPVDVVDRKFFGFANKILNSLISADGFKRHDHLFNSVEFGRTCHFTNLAKDLIEIYVRLRLMYLSREVKIGISDFNGCGMKYTLGKFWA